MALMKVLLLLGLGVSVNSAVSLQKRIIGGHNCADTERHYHVRLEMTNGAQRIFCGGSLIHPMWILTAASCWKSDTGWNNVAKLNVHPRTAKQTHFIAQDLTVVYTSGNMKHEIMLLKLPRPVTGVPIVPLPDCRRRPNVYVFSGQKHDIRFSVSSPAASASAHLSQVISPPAGPEPVELRCVGPETHVKDTGLEKDTPVGDTVQLAGEGGTTTGHNNRRLPGNATATHLQCIDMKVAGSPHFVAAYGHVFSAAAPNKDVCHGDAGSAVVFNGMIYGVISPVLSEHAFQIRVFITDVCEYIGWIRTTTGIKENKLS